MLAIRRCGLDDLAAADLMVISSALDLLDNEPDIALEAAQACYFEHAGLIEFAWLDQFYFGEWSEENLRD